MTTRQMVLTAGGLALEAAAKVNSTTPILDRIKLGEAMYTPTGMETDITTPFSPVREFVNPSGTARGDDFQVVLIDESSDDYQGGEMGVFSGSTLFAISSDPNNPIINKVAANPLVFRLAGRYSGANLTQVTFMTVDPSPMGSDGIAGLWRGADAAAVTARTPNQVLTTDRLDQILGLVPGTDLSVTLTTSGITIRSSTGTNVQIPVATTLLSGVLSAADKVHLNRLVSGEISVVVLTQAAYDVLTPAARTFYVIEG